MVLTNRGSYIGGSEANLIYMGYGTKTFRNWWTQKLLGVHLPSHSNRNMLVGTILEHEIIDLYEKVNNVKGQREQTKTKGIARANTDYILDDKVIDVKASKSAHEWVLSGTVPIAYRRQLIHYCYVFGLKKASIIAYQVDDSLLVNPFQELDESNLFEIEVNIMDSKIIAHRQKLDYLTECREKNIYPEVRK